MADRALGTTAVLLLCMIVFVNGCTPVLTDLPCVRDENCPTGLRCVDLRCIEGNAGGAPLGGGRSGAGGSTSGGSAGGDATGGGSAGGDPTGGGSAGGDATGGGSAGGDATGGGSAGGDALGGGSVGGGSVGGGSAGGGSVGGGSVGGGSVGGGSGGGGSVGGGSGGGGFGGGGFGGGGSVGGGSGGGGSGLSDAGLSGSDGGSVDAGSGGGSPGDAGPLCSPRPPGPSPTECSGGRQFRNPIALSGVNNSVFAVAGDLDRDCNPDLVVQEGPPPANLWMLRGRGDGTFVAPVSLASQNHEPLLADVNRDGLLDVLVSRASGTARIGVLLNLGGGTFRSMVQFDTTDSLGIAAGDLDGDGIQNDIATGTNDWGSPVDGVILRGVRVADGGVATRTNYDFGSVKTWSVAIADLDRTAASDVVFGRFTFTSGGITVVRSVDGGLGSPVAYAAPNGSYPIVVGVADVTGDGWNDIVAGLWATGQVAVWTNQGNGTFTNANVTPLSFSNCNAGSGCLWGMAVTDLNRDGRADVVVPGINDNRVSVLLSAPGSVSFPVVSETYTVNRPLRVTSADFNRDGRQDIAVVSDTGPTVLFVHCP
jgi:hypothetical protein